MLYSQGDMLGRDLSEKLGLKFSLIEGIIDHFKHQRFIEAKKSLGMGNSTVLFALTETGRNHARECLEATNMPARRRFRYINTRTSSAGNGAPMAGSRPKLCSTLTGGWW